MKMGFSPKTGSSFLLKAHSGREVDLEDGCLGNLTGVYWDSGAEFSLGGIRETEGR